MTIIEIINNNHIFGFGQLSHNPREYYRDPTADIILGWQKEHIEPDAVIKTDVGDISVYNLGGFCAKIDLHNGFIPVCEKRLDNTASPECICAAVEEQLRIMERSMSPVPVNPLRLRREAAKLTRAEFAELSGVHSQLITKFELGERDLANASYATVMKLANALQCRPEKILVCSNYASYPLDK